MTEPGQLVITGVSGTQLTPEEQSFIAKEKIGGVLLFARNYEDPGQLVELTNSIQSLRGDYPLFIAVDQEGGRVARFKKGFTEIPPMFDLAKVASADMSFRVAEIMARELAACGVNVNFAPVCDIWINPENQVIGDRAFGRDEKTVSAHASAMIRGLQENGVLACAKHFPGHGSTKEDSHLELPVLEKEEASLEDLRAREFVPFREAIDSGVAFVMMAHLMAQGIDSKSPASLSPYTHKILREELKFSKLIISDDMQMGAITDNLGMEEASVLAILAGSDMIEYRDMECAGRALEELKRAKGRKILRDKLIEQKNRRILQAKREHFADYQPADTKKAQRELASEESAEFMAELKEKILIS